MDPLQLINSYSGVARTSTLIKGGASRHRISSAVAKGELLRPRLGWVCLPSIDRELQQVIRAGVIISCISRARRLGLWVHSEPQRHVAARTPISRADSKTFHVHWNKPLYPRTPDEVEDSLVNVLALVASCQPFERAHAIWESALNERLTTLEKLRRIPFSPRATAVLNSCTRLSDSGLESIFATRFKFLGLRITPQASIHGHRVDFLLGERLVVQIDGGSHVGRQRQSDIRHDARLKLHGFHVLRFSYDDIMNDAAHVRTTILDAVAQRLHLA